ncbi:hypothetical protein WJX72_010941 [[Myrmecia] bisecta]|uniref:Uncharacterized protein n=1 Tax=[Myrmecia] bisecta TaxID=41462 RepID=A0AAW1Q4R7_9CHLO
MHRRHDCRCGAARNPEGASAEERVRHTCKAVKSPFLPCAGLLSQVPASWPAMRAAGAMRLAVALLKAANEGASDLQFPTLDQGIVLAMHIAADPEFKLDASIDTVPLSILFRALSGASDCVLPPCPPHSCICWTSTPSWGSSSWTRGWALRGCYRPGEMLMTTGCCVLAAALSMALDQQAAEAKAKAVALSFTGQFGCGIGMLSGLLWRLMKPADYDCVANGEQDVAMRLGTALLMLPREIAPNGMCQARPERSSEPPPDAELAFLRGPATACCLLAGGIANHPGIAGSFSSVACWQSAVEMFETLARIITTFDLSQVPVAHFQSIGPPQLVLNMLQHFIKRRTREFARPLVHLVGWLVKALLKGVCGFGRRHWRVHMEFFCKILAAAGELLRQEPDESTAGSAFFVAVSSVGTALKNLLQDAGDIRARAPQMSEVVGDDTAKNVQVMLGDLISCLHKLSRHIGSRSAAIQASLQDLHETYKMHNPDVQALLKLEDRQVLEALLERINELATAENTASAAGGKQRLVFELCQELEVASAMLVQQSASPDVALQITLLSLQTVIALLRGIPAFRSTAAAPAIASAFEQILWLQNDVLRCVPGGSQLDARPVASLVRGILLLLRDGTCGQLNLHAAITDKFVALLQHLIERSPNEALNPYRGVHELICCEDATPALIRGMLAANDTAWMAHWFLTQLLTPHATQDNVQRSQAHLCAALLRPEFDLVPILLAHVQAPVTDADSAANTPAPIASKAYSSTLQLIAQMAADPEALEAESTVAVANIDTLFAALRRPHGADRDAAITALAFVLEYERTACDVLTYQALQPPPLSPIKGLLDAWGSASNSWQLRAAIAKCLGNVAPLEGGVAALA